MRTDDERLFCANVNDAIWKDCEERVVFYPDAPFVMDLGLSPASFVASRFPDGWDPAWKINLDDPITFT